MHSENPKISNFHWVTKLNFGGVPNFERFRKNAHVDQRFTAFSASPPLRWPQAPDAEPIANLAANVGGLDSSGCGSWLSMDGGHGALGTPARADFFANEIRSAVRLGERMPRRNLEGLRQDGLLQSEVCKNVNRLSVGMDSRGVITGNGSCRCDRNRTQDQGGGQHARNFRNHNGSPLVSDRPSPAYK